MNNIDISYFEYRWLARLKLISMLHIETLYSIYQWSIDSTNVLEVGTYVGGSTIALSKGTKGRVYAIEPGGSFNHAQIPSSDILRDLSINLKKWKCNNVQIIKGVSEDKEVLNLLKNILSTNKIDLLVLDANGNIIEFLKQYRQLLDNECKIVIDDYAVEGNSSGGKNLIVVSEVDTLVKEGVLSKQFINGYGTYFGKINFMAIENLKC